MHYNIIYLLILYTVGEKSAKVSNAIIFMIPKDNLPLNTTDKEGFKYLMKAITAVYNLLGGKVITKLMDQKMKRCLPRLKISLGRLIKLH